MSYIQKEFCKQAFWWSSLSPQKQDEYLRRHKHSRLRYPYQRNQRILIDDHGNRFWGTVKKIDVEDNQLKLKVLSDRQDEPIIIPESMVVANVPNVEETMYHSGVIQSEFVKEARKWKDLTYEDQKAYLKRHPASKRKITAKPEGKSKTDDDSSKPESSKPESTNFLDKIEGKSHSELKAEIASLQAKIDKRNEAARRREQRAQGNLDGTALDAAYEKNQPSELRIQLIKHYLEHGTKPLPKELKEEVERRQAEIASHNEYKQEKQQEKEKHAHLVGKVITWKSRKNFGKEMSGRVVSLKVGKHGSVIAKTDTGWRVPVSMIEKSKEPPKDEKTKELVQAKDLIGQTVSWKTKYRPNSFRSLRGMRGVKIQRSAPPGFDPATGMASGKVESAKGSKVVVGNWRIPLPLIQKLNGKAFEKWK